MTYSPIFSLSAAAEKLTVRAFSFSVWGLAVVTLAFLKGCKHSYQFGLGVRAWWESTGRDWAVTEIEPCVDVAKEAAAWVFGVERLWSAQQLPITLAANDHFWDEVCNEYRTLGNSITSAVDTYLMGI